MDKTNQTNVENQDNNILLKLSPPLPTTTIPPPHPTDVRQKRRRSPSPPPPPPPAIMVPAFPWSGNDRAKVRSLQYLRAERICKVSGEVQCKKCERTYRMELDLEEKFKEVATFFYRNIDSMNQRAPEIWMKPALPNCNNCQERNCVRPVIADDNDSINWLFLFLGQMLGCCTMKQLKFFLQHANIHRTAAKNFLLFYTYEELVNQLMS